MIIKMHFRSEQKIDFLGPFDSDLLCTCFCIKTDIFSFVERNKHFQFKPYFFCQITKFYNWQQHLLLCSRLNYLARVGHKAYLIMGLGLQFVDLLLIRDAIGRLLTNMGLF